MFFRFGDTSFSFVGMIAASEKLPASDLHAFRVILRSQKFKNAIHSIFPPAMRDVSCCV
jgi:hypothetical protein